MQQLELSLFFTSLFAKIALKPWLHSSHSKLGCSNTPELCHTTRKSRQPSQRIFRCAQSAHSGTDWANFNK